MSTPVDSGDIDVATLGHRIRHFRTRRGMTLDALGAAAGVAASQLSLIENGKREPRISLLSALASALGVQPADLLSAEPPDERAALEIELARAQRGSLYASLGLPAVKPTKGTPTET
ncbi:MAG: helix-turn-helix transcriptional regulator, partial [Leifsonia sp.]|nr:helix-turn-helix transcriptional regulator [Leifsonia sp.]